MSKVLIAEDELLISDMLEEVLIDGGYEVCGIARTVAEGIALAEFHKPDLALLDMRLAKGGLGTEIAARLDRTHGLGILYATGNMGQLYLTKNDGEAYLGKPYRAVDVVRALKIVEEIIGTGKASRRCCQSQANSSPRVVGGAGANEPRRRGSATRPGRLSVGLCIDLG